MTYQTKCPGGQSRIAAMIVSMDAMLKEAFEVTIGERYAGIHREQGFVFALVSSIAVGRDAECL